MFLASRAACLIPVIATYDNNATAQKLFGSAAARKKGI
jgi:hypothetical protein